MTDQKEGTAAMTEEQRRIIENVRATMEIEDMPLTQEAERNVADIIAGRKTVDEVVAETDRRYPL